MILSVCLSVWLLVLLSTLVGASLYPRGTSFLHFIFSLICQPTLPESRQCISRICEQRYAGNTSVSLSPRFYIPPFQVWRLSRRPRRLHSIFTLTSSPLSGMEASPSKKPSREDTSDFSICFCNMAQTFTSKTNWTRHRFTLQLELATKKWSTTSWKGEARWDENRWDETRQDNMRLVR